MASATETETEPQTQTRWIPAGDLRGTRLTRYGTTRSSTAPRPSNHSMEPPGAAQLPGHLITVWEHQEQHGSPAISSQGRGATEPIKRRLRGPKRDLRPEEGAYRPISPLLRHQDKNLGRKSTIQLQTQSLGLSPSGGKEIRLTAASPTAGQGMCKGKH
ncbi:hypothetical protein NHX12_023115 [Muraenolepis orangiensis]|uniref:Uncharacterized protein n=1 Tax=Muraenolepis orangiensis TaxID=630683 RepID=A0A9Q0EN34_9TELE|nr:hypothetical protein NHX12_023115 [Muraenolepis orangiensis]